MHRVIPLTAEKNILIPFNAPYFTHTLFQSLSLCLSLTHTSLSSLAFYDGDIGQPLRFSFHVAFAFSFPSPLQFSEAVIEEWYQTTINSSILI
ncbi:hypothetical protein L1887_17710 [Cichorium endivia]|nr:hypothetical protein L1887_17710 [Cichorium endivia]